MERKLFNQYQARANVIKALAHPTRLFIVDELSRSERCVCDLRDMVGADFSTVSKHLSILKNAGIVDAEKRGAQVIYRLRIPCVLHFFECVSQIIESVAKEQLQLVEIS
ncbi:MAG: winged helix-turn-helix transcriptional regulator [Acidobacteria bacterium]|nr:winged helix-turn-helix transcriptional regulator [Acidobacteriota bacterium]